MGMPTKRERVRVARGMAMATRMTGDKNGDDDGDKHGNGD